MHDAVSVVIATHDRPVLVRRAIRSVLDQTHPGRVDVVVVYDQCEPYPHLVDGDLPENRGVRWVVNDARTPGLAGARNTGVLASEHEVVGFLDDDDEWFPDKLERQLALWREHPEAVAVSGGIVIRSEGVDRVREAPAVLTFDDLLQSRVVAVNPCTLLTRRSDLLDRVGLVDEAIPGSYGEDYEWLLRATRHGVVVSVPEPLVRVNWDRPSHFAFKWAAVVEGLEYLVQQVPEFRARPRALARLRAQQAFAWAALGQRRRALRHAREAFPHRRADPRLVATLLVCAGWPAGALLRGAQRFGRGL